MGASVSRYPLRRDGEHLFKIDAAARGLLDVGVYLVLPDASVTHGLDGAAQDGNRVVLDKKPDFDVRKFSIQVVQPLASRGSADRGNRLRKFRLVCLCQSFARNGRCDTKAAGSEAALFMTARRTTSSFQAAGRLRMPFRACCQGSSFTARTCAVDRMYVTVRGHQISGPRPATGARPAELGGSGGSGS
jgi:hypothetical protein